MIQKCFVIQPFDGGQRYDKRYEDIFKPAIEAAGLEPYRVDEDPAAGNLIEEIERRIAESVACVAEITTDNPNVWFELGYAFAMKKIAVMVCSDERNGAFPFDVQHRSIIKYSTDSTSDFTKAQKMITAQLKAKTRKREQMDRFPAVVSISDVRGLEQYEIAGLIAVAGEIDGELSTYRFYKDMEGAGFTRLAATLAQRMLVDRGMVEGDQETDYNGETYDLLRVTTQGMAWLLDNQDQLLLRSDASNARRSRSAPDDDLPF
ncbi:MAG: hypothetical protein OXN92_02490 [Gammaproteobacteria bacterium]|nr:hypothetical protein [Gammaproteobacteria bacterium]